MFLGFSKRETLFVSIFLTIIFGAIFFNLQTSERRSRDFQRKEDVNNITKVVEMFREKYGVLPQSDNEGRIVGCNPQEAGKDIKFSACAWGDEILPGVRVPVDPRNDDGFAYRYISSSKHYQAFGAMESDDEAEYDTKIVARGLICGINICNLGRASSNTPVDISLEEYESRLDKLNSE